MRMCTSYEKNKWLDVLGSVGVHPLVLTVWSGKEICSNNVVTWKEWDPVLQGSMTMTPRDIKEGD